MRAHLLVVAIAGLSLTAAVAAEPAKAPVRKAEQPADEATAVVVASADEARQETPADARPEAATPAKPRHARVTTCRCGDQNPSEQ